MFNFQNMNDYEFELLCKDILQAKIGMRLRTYNKGKDGGIDISCFAFIAGNTTIIAQVKHYINSTFPSLIRNLRNEVKKVKLLDPKDYYVCTSLRLTPVNVREIYDLFKEHMSSPENIYDGAIIDDFLSQEANIDIVNRNYKLWLASSNVLELLNNRNIFIDTHELMFAIEREVRFFVETEAYHEALKLLDKERMIIIIGDPGVGKTTISKMLLLYHAQKGYTVRYASDNSIKDIKKALSYDSSKKEIILMDDFLGQHYLHLKEDQPSEIKSLIAHVLGAKSKRLILNSRITILNEAMRKSFDLRNFLGDNEIRRYRIDLNQMPVVEKAKIFYNHIYFNSLPLEYFIDIKKDFRYIDIVSHNNYNPRIIEYVTKERNYKNCKDIEYYEFIINKLQNPLDVWEDEFCNRIDNFDRLLMHTIYSLTDTFIDKKILNRCFNNRIRQEPGYDSTRNMFSECLLRLTQSMVRIIDHKEGAKVGVFNPSINDYMFHYLAQNENEINAMLEHSVYIEQLNRIGKINERAAASLKVLKVRNNEFLTMEAITKTIKYHYLEFIDSTKYKDLAIKEKIIEIMSDPATYSGVTRNESSKLLCRIFSSNDLFHYYDLGGLLFDFNKMKAVFDQLVFEDINVVLSIYKNYCNMGRGDEPQWIESLSSALEECICNNISEEVESDIEDELHSLVDDAIAQADEGAKDDYRWGRERPLVKTVENSLISKIEELIDDRKNQIDDELFPISELEILPEEILGQISYTTHIDNYFQEEPDDDHRYSGSTSSSYEEVHQIFDRKYIL